MTGIKVTPQELIDVSKWVPGINWDCMKSKGLMWAALRATVSNYYTDPTFFPNSDNCKRVGIHRPPYHVTRADKTILGVDNSPTRQMDYFSGAINGRHDGVVILDVELAMSYENQTLKLPKQQVTDVNMKCWEIAKSRYDSVLFYSRASFMDEFMLLDSRFKKLDLYMAEYGRDNGLWYGCTLIPEGCTKDQIVIHQFSGKGEPFCCSSIVNAIDYDIVINQPRFNEIHKIKDVENPPPPISGEWDEPRIMDLETRLETLELLTSDLLNRLNNIKEVV